MKNDPVGRPEAGEYDPYYETYIGRLDGGSIFSKLAQQSGVVRDQMSGLIAGGGDYRYAPGKWSVKQILGHLADSERIFGMRATCIARGDLAELPGFEQDDYVDAGGFDQRTIESLVREFEFLRAANLEMFGGLEPTAWRIVGKANDSPISVRAIAWILAGHTDHHLTVLGERYGAAFSA
ncbi:MAG: DinB family protein [Gemmatimonadota bacterium]|nr:DinB family protein [Gemmatimonadota bacterium]